MKTIKQIADEIGVSKQAIYDKIKKEPLSSALKGLTEKVDKTLHIKLDGVELIKSAFNKDKQSSVSSKELDNISKVLIETLQKQIDTLTSQLEIKDSQIEELTATVRIQAETAKATHHNELAETIIEGQKQLTNGKSEKKGFFKRFFAKGEKHD